MKKILHQLLAEIDARSPKMTKIKKYWENESPLAFVSKESKDALGGKLDRLSVNFTRVVVNSHTERQTVRSFTRAGADKPDTRLWAQWLAAGMEDKAELVHTDRALYGVAYVTVWGSLSNALRPVVMLDTPFTANVKTDPGTGDVTAAVRWWQDGPNRRAVLWTDNFVSRWHSKSGDVLASGDWTLDSTGGNDLEMVPMVPFIRRESIGDKGTSVAVDVFDISDALAKLLIDAMVTSEDYAKPRRYATGLEIEEQEDEDGNVSTVDPFGRGRNLQSEAPETKFGQLNGSSVDTYTGLIATLTQLIGMLTGMPPHYLGLHGDQPANSDSVKAAEAQLISRVRTEIKKLTAPWATVAALIDAVAAGMVPSAAPIITAFESPELRTPNQAADAAVKLKALGIPLRNLLVNPLEYPEPEVTDIMANYESEQIKQAAFALRNAIPEATKP